MNFALSFKNKQDSNSAWQAKVRSKFLDLTGYHNIPQENWRLLETVESKNNGVLCRRHLLEYGSWKAQPVYEFLPPDGKINGLTLIALHGHVFDLFGVGAEYIMDLARRGYRCFTPVLFGMLERKVRAIDGPITEYCREATLETDKIGVSLLGMRLFDARLAYQFAKSVPDVDGANIGCVGLSMGGELSLYLAAIEQNIKCCVSAGFLDTFEGLLIRSRNCHCYSVRDWLRWFDMPDIVGCIAPRPLLVQKGESDGCFIAEDVEDAVKMVKNVYSGYGENEKFTYQTYPGEHILNVDLAVRWLRRL